VCLRRHPSKITDRAVPPGHSDTSAIGLLSADRPRSPLLCGPSTQYCMSIAIREAQISPRLGDWRDGRPTEVQSGWEKDWVSRSMGRSAAPGAFHRRRTGVNADEHYDPGRRPRPAATAHPHTCVAPARSGYFRLKLWRWSVACAVVWVPAGAQALCLNAGAQARGLDAGSAARPGRPARRAAVTALHDPAWAARRRSGYRSAGPRPLPSARRCPHPSARRCPHPSAGRCPHPSAGRCPHPSAERCPHPGGESRSPARRACTDASPAAGVRGR
jgi:hypothetical protein